ncbi:type I MADS-domain transcription factor [Selaginella moellendorffii]|uniref:Type I MADS-domain transcription factor n=1 Tax=Selaginella moellendorffii TaxID=88036 RepID=D8SJQ0_SELML|nr:type I MADS-domain transcription factor [Selaginella moellendorffii]
MITLKHVTSSSKEVNALDDRQKKSGGRKKIPIKFITDPEARKSCFKKRVGGLFKKAWEINLLANPVVELLVYHEETKKFYRFVSTDGEPDLKLLPASMARVIKQHREEMNNANASGEDRGSPDPSSPSTDTSALESSSSQGGGDEECDDDDDEEEEECEDWQQLFMKEENLQFQGGGVLQPQGQEQDHVFGSNNTQVDPMHHIKLESGEIQNLDNVVLDDFDVSEWLLEGPSE